MNSLLKPLITLQKASKEYGTSSLSSSQDPNDHSELSNFLQKITCKDVGIRLTHLDSYFRENTLTCIKVPDTHNIMIDIFCVPKGMHLNLHDHPNTVVITKVLHGSINQRSLDLIDKSYQQREQTAIIEEEKFTNNPVELEAILHADKTLGVNDITFLTPNQGNIHSFTAYDDTIFLDISIPINDEFSFSNYYQEMTMEHRGDNEEKGKVVLKPILPSNMKICMRRYEGEPVGNHY